MKTLEALLRLAPLDRLPRTGWIQAGIAHPESVAGHTLGVAEIALALGPRVEPPLDVDRAVALALVHDLPEAWLSDLPRTASRLLPPGAKAAAEARAAEGLLGPLSDTALERHAEYVDAETREARFARVCDGLHLGVRLVGYRREGRGGLAEFVESVEALDASEFAPCAALRAEILEALGAAPPPPGGSS